MPQATTTQQLHSVEIDFYNHEIYDGQKLIARITYDHRDFVTERWVVEVNNQEVFRRSWYQSQVGCTDGQLWYIRASSNHRQNVASARNAVVALSGVQPVFFEDLMDKPFDQITPEEWLILGEYEPVQDLVAA